MEVTGVVFLVSKAGRQASQRRQTAAGASNALHNGTASDNPEHAGGGGRDYRGGGRNYPGTADG